MRDHLLLAGGASAAGHHLEVALIITPRQGGVGRRIVDPPVGDQRSEAGTAHLEQREQIVDGMCAEGSVTEDEVDGIGSRNTEPVELVDICRQLHEGRDPSGAGELGVLYAPASVVVTLQEIGESDELGSRERRLEDDRRVGCERLDRLVDGGRERHGIDGRHLLDAVHPTIAEVVDVARQDVLLVHVSELGGAGERGVLRLHDRVYAPQLGVDRSAPGEFAFRGCL